MAQANHAGNENNAINEINTIHQRSPHEKGRLYRFAFARITVIALLALFCVGIAVSLVNDLYAFVKPDEAVTLSWTDPLPLAELSRSLQKNGVIRNPTAFSLYVRSKGKVDALEAFTGTLTLNSSMSYREILMAFEE